MRRGGGAGRQRGRWALVGLMLAGCARGGEERSERGARLEVEWTGADTGKLSAPAVAEWCGRPPMLEIRALQGDTGIALALYPTDTVRADSYPVLPPERVDSARPAAAVALRWFGETAVKGFRGDSGGVIVESRAGGPLAGRFSAVLQSATDTARLHATGDFRGLVVVPSARGCVPRPVGQPPDTGVH